MCYFVIIRGPAGVSKTTVSKKLAARLNGAYISFDKIMRSNHLDKIEGVCISEKNFIKANEIAIPKAIKNLKKDKIVVFDGCFYHKFQLEHILKNIPFNSFTFTLKATLDECISRDKKRNKKAQIGEKRVREVHDLMLRFDYGIEIDTTDKIPEDCVTEILFKLPKFFTK